MNRLTVPGGWIEFREPEEVAEKYRRNVMKLSQRGARYSKYALPDGSFDTEAMTEEESGDLIGFMSDFNDAVAVALINAWSFDFPVTAENLLELPGAVYDLIVKHCSPLASRLLPTFSADDADDPKATTANS